MTTTPHVLLLGPEPLRRHLRESGDHLLVDARDEDVTAGVRSAGLFTTGVRVVHAEDLDTDGVTALAEALAAVDLPVVVEAEKLTPANEKRLAAVSSVRKLSLTSNGRTSVTEIAARLGLRLDGAVLDVLLERLAHDPGRLVGTLEALAAGGFAVPSAAQVRLLAGSSQTEGLPWTLLDEIERGHGDAAATLERVEAIPTIAFLAKRVRIAAYAAEHPDHGREEAADAIGEISEGAWRQARRLAERIGPDRCHRLLPLLAQADVHAKRGRPGAALALATGGLRLAILEAGTGR